MHKLCISKIVRYIEFENFWNLFSTIVMLFETKSLFFGSFDELKCINCVNLLPLECQSYQKCDQKPVKVPHHSWGVEP